MFSNVAVFLKSTIKGETFETNATNCYILRLETILSHFNFDFERVSFSLKDRKKYGHREIDTCIRRNTKF